MAQYAFRLLNVFAESTFGGNPLCVFEDARGMNDESMLALARQFNLSETTFILPSDAADARVRIFTPGYEMKFAGHPTLGTAHVVRALNKTGESLRLEMKAGVVRVTATDDDVWTFAAPGGGDFAARAAGLSPTALCAMFGLDAGDVAGEAMWLNTGADQLLIPLSSADAVRRAQAMSDRLADWPLSSLGRKTAYLFAADHWSCPAHVTARYFFTTQGGGVSEDPGTGSACANLGAWLLQAGHRPPFEIRVSQGDAVSRPCRLHLAVGANSEIRVGGRVIEIGRGTVDV